MTDKTRAKIEAMAEPYSESRDDETYVEGATPWAEWCERLALTMSYITDEANGKNECHNMAKVALSDYEKWLEDING